MGSPKPKTTGKNYFGSFVLAVGIGPATRLTRITNGETEIWSGDIDQTGRDSDGYTTLDTTIGSIHWGWGRADQNPHPFLVGSEIDFGSGAINVIIPGWRRIILAICEDIAFGSSTSPPTLKFEFERELSDLTLSSHALSGDAVLPEVLYNIYADTLYGGGIPAARIDSASFEAAGETIITEDLGVSPFLDEFITLREWVGGLLAYIDAFPRFTDGKIELQLIRKQSTSGIPVIDESVLASEPVATNSGWTDSWNVTHLVFTERAEDWDKGATEVWNDSANTAITGERVDEEIRMPYITRRDVAKRVARRKGIRAGAPGMAWELELLPSMRTLKPGDIAWMNYARRGISNRLVRVTEIGRSAGDNQVVRALVEDERTRDEANDYEIPTDEFLRTTEIFNLASTTPRLAWLPPDLKSSDGLLVACHRPTLSSEGFKVHFTWDPAQKAYAEIAAVTSFPMYGTLQWWTPSKDQTAVILRIDFQTTNEADQCFEWLDESIEMYAVAARRLYKSTGSVIDEHQADALWMRTVEGGHLRKATTTAVEIEVTAEAFGSEAPVLETLAAQGVFPTANIYLGRQEDFLIHPTGSIYFERHYGNQREVLRRTNQGIRVIQTGDTALERYIKATVYTVTQAQSPDDVTANVYDRDDTTMCPDGTYDTDWGDRALSLPELFDAVGYRTTFGETHPDEASIEFADTDLAAMFWGLYDENVPLDITIEAADETDVILGILSSTDQTIYSRTE